MPFRIPRLEPREATASDRLWLLVTVAVGIVGTCHGALPHGARAHAVSARSAALHRAHAAAAPAPPPARAP